MNESNITLHLTPVEIWEPQSNLKAYVPEAFQSDGFIHCTDGEARVLDVGNRHYMADPRRFCLLSIDVSRLTSRVIYEDPDRVFPHIYGALNADAVIAVRSVERDADGRFIAIRDALQLVRPQD
jgi:uncharacterized protein (DUF952 family)